MQGAAAPVDEIEEVRESSRLQQRVTQLLRVRELGVLGAAVAIFVYLSIARPDTFLSEFTLVGMVRSFSLIGIVAVGMTFLFIAGEIDLSVGSMYAFLSVVCAYLIVRQDWDWTLAAPAAILLGAGLGAFNGVVTTLLRIPSFIVTLGMLSALRGGALVVSGGNAIPGVKDPTFHDLVSGDVIVPGLGWTVPAQIFWFIGVVIVGAWVLGKTRFGYHVYATGDNVRAAKNAGIRTTQVKIACFVLTGALAGLVGVITTGWLSNGNPISGQAWELEVIAAVVIGGTALRGGSGSVLGTFLGAAIAGMIRQGLVLLGYDIDTVPIALGAVIVLAVLLDLTIQRRQGLMGRE